MTLLRHSLTEYDACKQMARLFSGSDLLLQFPMPRLQSLFLHWYRKQLLNKCQEEFEKGAAAMEAVEAREKANEGKSKEEQDKDQAEVHITYPLSLLHSMQGVCYFWMCQLVQRNLCC